ncbi:MAG: 5-oxoprolinase subunit PxpA [Pseudomonadota bacterium]
MQIDLNADLGEGCGDDAALLPYVSSCNIACGGHVGDDISMHTTLEAAKQAGVAAGAHPSYPDKTGFGRRAMRLSYSSLLNSLSEQLDALQARAMEVAFPLTHLKPHGALYHHARADAQTARCIVESLSRCDLELAIVGPEDGELMLAAHAAGLIYRKEGFVDRRYAAVGRLVSRDEPNAVLASPGECAEQALALASDRSRTIDTLCLHGDTEHAIQIAARVHRILTESGFSIGAPAHA